MSFVLGVAVLAVVTSLTCALPGVFVVLRGHSMLVDAISHAVLPGIVAGFALTHDMGSPLLVLGAALAGLVVVFGTEALARTGLLAGDAPQGLVFPALFSLGVIAVSTHFGDLHMDVEAVLVGDLNLAGFAQLTIGGVDLGPRLAYLMVALGVANAAFVAATYPRLLASTFDPEFSRVAGLGPRRLGAGSMFLLALTVTAAFDAAGAVLVVALVVVPAATARLLTDRVPTLIWGALAIAAGGAWCGFWLAYVLDAPTSAGMAVFYGAIFAVAFVVSRGRRRGAGTAGAAPVAETAPAGR